jgi:FkbM family methyltransferase
VPRRLGQGLFVLNVDEEYQYMMKRMLKSFSNKIVSNSPWEPFARQLHTKISLSKGAKYDREISAVMKRILRKDSNCIDIGCYRGTILREMMKYAPNGTHFAFEPIRENYNYLINNFQSSNIFNIALSDYKGNSKFQHVVNMPARSGFLKVEYPYGDEVIHEITVGVDTLDNIVPNETPIRLIKIDVEGAELSVLRGGRQIIARYKPIIIFEYGMPKAKFYGEEPEQINTFLTEEFGLEVSLMERWLRGEQGFSPGEFSMLVKERREFNFIASPKAAPSPMHSA